jgi:hypothetical protein
VAPRGHTEEERSWDVEIAAAASIFLSRGCIDTELFRVWTDGIDRLRRMLRDGSRGLRSKGSVSISKTTRKGHLRMRISCCVSDVN